MSRAVLTIWLLVYICLSGTAYALSEEMEVDRLTIQGMQAFKAADFKAAEESFSALEAMNTKLSDKFYYFYGVTLINNHKFSLAKKYLEKYLTIIGSSQGELYSEALEAYNKADKAVSQAQKEAMADMERKLNPLQKSAESGDEAAMRELANRYSSGDGAPLDNDKAIHWKNAANALMEKEFVSANNGNIQAIEKIANRYNTGNGVNQDSTKANAWLSKAKVLKQEKIARDRIQAEKDLAQTKLNNFTFFEATRNGMNDMKRKDPLSVTTSLPIVILVAPMFDLISAPINTSKYISIQNEATARAASWAKPDSMIAKSATIKEKSGVLASN